MAHAAAATFGMRAGTEQPRYDVTGRAGSAEIRRYGPRLAAMTDVDGPGRAALSAGFRRLAGYIFGANHVARQIAMTAPVGQFPVVQSPVVQSPAGRTIAMTAPVAHAPNPDGSWTVRFFMPAAETPETLPEPNDPAVRLVMVPASTCAVLRFSGRPTEAAIASARRLLLATLAGSLWRPAGEPLIWYYDPPWTLPFLRRNEVVMPVVPATLAPTALAPAAPAASGAAPDVTAAPR